MRSLLAAVLVPFALPLAAETRQHGNLVFDIPPGWESGARWQDGTLILWSDLPEDECEFCRVYLSSGARSGGKVVDWVASQSRRFVEEDETDPPEITEMTASDVMNIKGRPGAMLGQTVDGDVQMLIAVQLFGRMELVGFEGPASGSEELAATMQVFQRDVMPMVEGLRFVSEGAQPLLPDPQPGGRSGVWWGTTNYWMMGLDGMMQMEIDHHWLTFWPDGLFYDGTPETGILPLDRATLLEQADMDWGSYTEANGKLVLHYASGEVEQMDVQADGLTDGTLTVYEVAPLADGTKVDGSVSSVFFSGFSPGVAAGGMSSSSFTQFNPDGRWRRESTGGAFGSFDNGAGFAVSSGDSDTGRYEVKNGVMIRYDAAGSVMDHDYIFKVGSDIWIGSQILGTGG